MPEVSKSTSMSVRQFATELLTLTRNLRPTETLSVFVPAALVAGSMYHDDRSVLDMAAFTSLCALQSLTALAARKAVAGTSRADSLDNFMKHVGGVFIDLGALVLSLGRETDTVPATALVATGLQLLLSTRVKEIREAATAVLALPEDAAED